MKRLISAENFKSKSKNVIFIGVTLENLIQENDFNKFHWIVNILKTITFLLRPFNIFLGHCELL